jgi:hypothetical protein
VRPRAVQAGLVGVVLSAAALVVPALVAAQPVSGPHETLDHRLTTTRPNAAAGFRFTGTYHAAGNRRGDPPYMRRMIFYTPPGMRYDTSVPARCTATDIELAARGPAACPPASRLGGGRVVGRFMGRFSNELQADFFNNTREQIILVRSPGLATVTRGRIRPDMSVEFAAPTCYPHVPPAGCPVDNALQIRSSIAVPRYTRSVRGKVRSWLTTPPRCPAAGHWRSPIRLWWADGSVDTVVTKQACRPRA